MTGKCIKCNKKLIVPCWKHCENCDPKRIIRQKIKRMHEEERIDYYGQKLNVDLKTFLKIKILLYDESNGKIIGWK